MNPEVLTCENVPKALHGVAPRTILGNKWWNEKRQEVYASNDYKCLACDTPKEDAFRKQLHAHEWYNINYKTGEVTVRDIVPVCPTCHDFIHSGRLLKTGLIEGRYQPSTVKMIMERGCYLLMSNDLKPSWSTCVNLDEMCFYIEIEKNVVTWVKTHYPKEPEACEWEEWHYLIEGEKHYGQFKSYDDWAAHYT